MKKKILLTGMGDRLGGIESFATVVVEGLMGKYEFSLLAATEKKIAKQDYFEKKGITVFHLKNIFGLKNAISRKKIFSDFLKEHDFDIIHINATTMNAVYMAEAASKLKIDIIYQIHNTAPSGYSVLARLLTKTLRNYYRFKIKRLKNVKCIAVSAEAAAATFGKNIPVRIVVNGVDTNKYCFSNKIRETMRAKYNISKSARVGIIVARLMPIKNHSKVLSVVNLGLQNKIFDYFMIVGDGPEKESIQNKIDRMRVDIKNKIFLCGERNDISNFLMMSDFMLLPSFTEGLSISVIEAQAAGVIPIVSNGIPTVTNITGNVIFLDVKASDCHWVEIIEKVLSTTTYDKIKMNQIVDDSEFSSRSFLKSISELYGVQ